MTPESLIADTQQLVSLPDIIIKANTLLSTDDVHSVELAELISHDQSLAAQLLKLVNSAFYKQRQHIDNITKAITLVGTDELRNLIYASKSAEIFSGISSELIDMETFFHRSIYAAALAKRLAILASLGRGEPQYLSGLFNDIGKLVLLSQHADIAQSIFNQSDTSGLPIATIEQETLGFTSSEVGAALLKAWQLPESIWQPLLQLHASTSPPTLPQETAILRLTVTITNLVEPELKNAIPPESDALPEHLLDILALNAEQVGIAVVDANLECYEVLSIICPDGFAPN